MKSGLKSMQVSLDRAGYERARGEGLTFIDYIRSEAARDECRIGIVDLRSGNSGSVFIPLHAAGKAKP